VKIASSQIERCRSFRLSSNFASGVSVGELVVRGGIAGVDGEFLFKLHGGFGQFGLVKIEFAKELMSERKLGIGWTAFFPYSRRWDRNRDEAASAL